MTIQASDPDVGDDGRLVYSLASDISYFDVEPSSGLVYVVSTVGLSGLLITFEVKATDPRGLNATTRVAVSVVCGGSTSVVRSNVKNPTYQTLRCPQVAVKENVNSNDVVTISLNQPANTVEKKVPELERWGTFSSGCSEPKPLGSCSYCFALRSLGDVLGWTVDIMEISNGGAPESRSLNFAVRSLVSFIALDGWKVVPPEEVIK